MVQQLVTAGFDGLNPSSLAMCDQPELQLVENPFSGKITEASIIISEGSYHNAWTFQHTLTRISPLFLVHRIATADGTLRPAERRSIRDRTKETREK